MNVQRTFVAAAAASVLAFAISLASPLRAQDSAALAALKAAAEQGDAGAQLAYAKAIKDRTVGREWAMKAAQQGLAEAWFWIGYTTPGDEALQFYEKAALGGYPEAFSYVFDGLLFRAGEKADVGKAKTFADLARTLKIPKIDEEDLVTADRCAEAGKADVPRADRPTSSEIRTFASVECDLILEGIGRPKDVAKYGRCVIAEDPVDPHKVAEVYANGYGVKRKAMTAIAFLCHSSDVPAELIDMVETLYDRRDDAKLDEPFVFCEHVTSGFNQGNCAMRDEAIDTARREAIVSTLTKGWPAPHIIAFKKLLDASEAFLHEHSSGELDMSGTARIAIAIDESTRLRQELLDDIHAFEAGTLPKRLDFNVADAELNAVYSQLMKKDALDLGTVDTQDIRDAQKAWLPLRDAWGAFGALRYPSLSVDAWKAWATSKRTAQLKALR